MKKRLIALIAIPGLSIGSVLAGEQAMHKEMFDRLDVYRDGHISRVELEARPDLVKELSINPDQSYTRADFNKDGKVDEAEFSAFEMIVPAE